MPLSPNVGKALVDSGAAFLEAMRLLVIDKGYEAVGYKSEASTSPTNTDTRPDLQPKPGNPVHPQPAVEPTVGPSEAPKVSKVQKSSY
jgi:hypothetical protein